MSFNLLCIVLCQCRSLRRSRGEQDWMLCRAPWQWRRLLTSVSWICINLPKPITMHMCVKFTSLYVKSCKHLISRELLQA